MWQHSLEEQSEKQPVESCRQHGVQHRSQHTHRQTHPADRQTTIGIASNAIALRTCCPDSFMLRFGAQQMKLPIVALLVAVAATVSVLLLLPHTLQAAETEATWPRAAAVVCYTL